MKNAVKKLGDIYHGDDEFVKSVEKPTVVSYSHSVLTAKMLKDKEPEFWTQSRNPIKIGRFIRQVFPGKYSDVDIEKFVNAFKSSDEKDLQKFILVEGEDIAKYYWYENYKEMAGDLGNIISPVLLGWLVDAHSYRPAFIATAAVFSLTLLLSAKMPETRKLNS